MSEEKMEKGLKAGRHGLHDPGTALIVVYVSVILLLLLFAGLESVRAESRGAAGKTLENMYQGELLTPSHTEGRFWAGKKIRNEMGALHLGADQDLGGTQMKANMLRGWQWTMKTATPSELQIILGLILLLLALVLAKDRKEQ